MDTNTVSLMIAIAGCFVGLAGWLRGRDGKLSNDAEWKGQVNAKLDIIAGVKTDVADLKEEVSNLEKKVVVVEQSAKSAHHRLDEHIRGGL